MKKTLSIILAIISLALVVAASYCFFQEAIGWGFLALGEAVVYGIIAISLYVEHTNSKDNNSVSANIYGTCGANVTWSLDTGTSVLTISGTGDMEDYHIVYHPAPWNTYRNKITRVIIKEDVTKIGSFAFSECPALTIVSFYGRNTTIKIGDFAFSNCPSLKRAILPLQTIMGAYSFDQCPLLKERTINCLENTKLYIGEKQTRFVGNQAYWGLSAFQEVYPNLFKSTYNATARHKLQALYGAVLDGLGDSKITEKVYNSLITTLEETEKIL